MLEGHSPGAVGVVRNDLDHLPAQLASEALLYRWNQRANTT
jgi:hypothetical protein